MRRLALVALVTGLATATHPPALLGSGDGHDKIQEQCSSLIRQMSDVTFAIMLTGSESCCAIVQGAQFAVEAVRGEKKACANNPEALEIVRKFIEMMTGLTEKAQKSCDEKPQGSAVKSCF